jgi:ribosome biogenesis GTPase
MSYSVLGTISHVFGRFYSVIKDDGSQIQCVLRGKTRLDGKWKLYSNPVAVGDIVRIDVASDESGTIEEIIPRRNAFTRKDKKDKGKDRRQDLIAANIDLIVVIQSFYDPHLNPRFVDRIAVRAGKERIPIVLCVNKLDLAGDDFCEYIHSYYRNAPIEVFFTSADTGKGIEELSALIKGKRSILIGYSGVGKTTLLNKLYPGINLRTSDVSVSTGKGRHTTTNVMMKRLPDGTEIIDTPGVREFGLMDIEPNELSDYFYEFPEYNRKCTYSPCSHDHEPGCSVKKAVEDGKISEERYISYLNILESIREYNSRVFSK